MPFEIIRNDITNMQVDAIVNAASRYPQIHAGVDAAIHKKAGPQLFEARKEIGFIQPGTAELTPAFDLDAKFVIHAATPIWEGGLHREEALLRNAYRSCLRLALEHNCESIAFPLLAAGNHGFPKQNALQAAIRVFSAFLLEHDIQIYLVVFGEESVHLSEKLVQNVSSFIDKHYVETYEKEIYGAAQYKRKYRISPKNEPLDASPTVFYCPAPREALLRTAPTSLEEFLRRKDAGFTEMLLQLIEKRGMKNSDVYKKANISKQHFSKIINDPNAKPSKQTAIALALALELDLADTKNLIGRAGYALTDSSIFDLIICYFIERRNYNIIEINIALYDFDQSLLGSS